MTDTNDPLSYNRIRDARATLTAAFREALQGFPGAIDADPAGAFSEAKRNLTALVAYRHGPEAFERILAEDDR